MVDFTHTHTHAGMHTWVLHINVLYSLLLWIQLLWLFFFLHIIPTQSCPTHQCCICNPIMQSCFFLQFPLALQKSTGRWIHSVNHRLWSWPCLVLRSLSTTISVFFLGFTLTACGSILATTTHRICGTVAARWVSAFFLLLGGVVFVRKKHHCKFVWLMFKFCIF